MRNSSGRSVSAPVTWEELAHVDPRDLNIRTVPQRLLATGDPSASIDDVEHSLEPLLAMYERDEERGLSDMPYPPDYPKMPGEPKRVQPSRAKRDASD